MSKLKDITGQRFTRLVVISRAKNRGKRVYWSCVCDCGNSFVARTDSLVSGSAKSCGCLLAEGCRSRSLTHGMSGTAEYKIWAAMKQRCRNPNAIGYADYGGRGISVCNRWFNSFEVFYADMGPRPSPKHSIDRIDNDGPYSPKNCQWSTWAVQNRNSRATRMITFRGETKCLTDWAIHVGLRKNTLTRRLDAGWPIEAALTEPVKRFGYSCRRKKPATSISSPHTPKNSDCRH